MKMLLELFNHHTGLLSSILEYISGPRDAAGWRTLWRLRLTCKCLNNVIKDMSWYIHKTALTKILKDAKIYKAVYSNDYDKGKVSFIAVGNNLKIYMSVPYLYFTQHKYGNKNYTLEVQTARKIDLDDTFNRSHGIVLHSDVNNDIIIPEWLYMLKGSRIIICKDRYPDYLIDHSSI
jgi:hypothetical protein